MRRWYDACSASCTPECGRRSARIGRRSASTSLARAKGHPARRGNMGVPLWEAFSGALALGRDVADVGAVAMALRTIVVFAFTLAIVRLGSKRFLGEASPFDFIVGIMLGSVMSRAINGSAPFFPTLVSGTVRSEERRVGK